MNKLVLLLSLLMISGNLFSNECATVFQKEGMTGAEMVLYDGDRILNLEDAVMQDGEHWDNKISSMRVQPECRLLIFQYQNLGRNWNTGEEIGEKRAYRNEELKILEIGDLSSFDNVASSLDCRCKKD